MPEPRLTPDRVAAALRRAGGSQAQAARLLGSGESTIARYRSRFPIVAEAYRPRSARPPCSRFTPEEVAAAILRARGVQKQAARLLHCSLHTISAYRAHFPAVREAYEQAWRERGRRGGHTAGGRYLRFTPEEVADAILQARGIKANACRLLHCRYERLNWYIDRYPAVRAAYDRARQSQLDLVESRLAAAVEAGEWPAVTYVLGKLGKKRGYDRRRPLEPQALPGDLPRGYAALVRDIYAHPEAPDDQEESEQDG